MDKKELSQRIGKIIRKARKAKNLTIEELAHRVDLSYAALSLIERAVQDDIKSSTLFALIKELDINPSLIFEETKLSKDKLEIFQNISALTPCEIAKFKEFKSLMSRIFKS